MLASSTRMISECKRSRGRHADSLIEHCSRNASSSLYTGMTIDSSGDTVRLCGPAYAAWALSCITVIV